MTPQTARELLRGLADNEMPELRPLPPAWPNAQHRNVIEYRAAYAACRTRVEHLLRLADCPDGVLQSLIVAGWDPRRRR